MYISTSRLFSAILFSSLALADLHTSCVCNNGDSYNWRITSKACTIYDDAGYQWGGAVYDTASGRCDQQNSTDRIAGDQWEEACKTIAKNGFDCADGQGTCFADADDVRGSC